MKRAGFACAAAVLCGVMAHAQVQEITLQDTPEAWKGRPYLLHINDHTTSSYSWNGERGMRAYAGVHQGGNYLLFVQDGNLYRIDTVAELDRLAQLQQPLQHLASLQSSLAANMEPLSATQSQLGASMHASTSYRDMGRIGHEQGIVGQRQGEIGRQQGVIGREQGLLGRALNQSTQQVIDRSLAAKTYVLVGPAEPSPPRS